MFARLKMYWTILRINLEERLVYRGDFMLGTLMRFLPIVTQIFLWKAVFAGSKKQTIGNYTYEEFVAYYLMTMIGRAFSSMPGLASGISRSIRDGTIKKFLIQPVDMVGFLLVSRIAHKLVYYLVAALPFALVFFLCRSYFPGWPPAPQLAAFFASLVMSFMIGYYLEATLGMIGFWFLEVNSLLFVYMLFSFFFSGHMFPLDMLPTPWNYLVQITPFQYLAYFPSAVFLQKITGDKLAIGLAMQVSWVLFFYVCSRVAFLRGIRRYSAFGG